MHHQCRDMDRFDVGGDVHVACSLDHGASGDRGRGGAECIGHQSSLLADRPAHPGPRSRIDEEVPIAIDQRHQGL